MKKKFIGLLFAFCFIFGIGIMFTGCGGKIITEIKLYDGEQELAYSPIFTYDYGTNIEIYDSLIIKAIYNDTTKELVSREGCSYSVSYSYGEISDQQQTDMPIKNSPVGNYTITLTYEEKTTTFVIEIKEGESNQTYIPKITFGTTYNQFPYATNFNDLTLTTLKAGTSLDSSNVLEYNYVSKTAYDELEEANKNIDYILNLNSGDAMAKPLNSAINYGGINAGQYYVFSKVQEQNYLAKYSTMTTFNVTKVPVIIKTKPTATYTFSTSEVENIKENITLSEIPFIGGTIEIATSEEDINNWDENDFGKFEFVISSKLVDGSNDGTSYPVKFVVSDNNKNYFSSAPVQVEINIIKGIVNAPSVENYWGNVEGGSTYTGLEQSIDIAYSYSGNSELEALGNALITVSGNNISNTNANTYTRSYALKYAKNYEWSEITNQESSYDEGIRTFTDSNTKCVFTWKILKREQMFANLCYDGHTSSYYVGEDFIYTKYEQDGYVLSLPKEHNNIISTSENVYTIIPADSTEYSYWTDNFEGFKGIASINGTTLTVSKCGYICIKVSNPGDSNYESETQYIIEKIEKADSNPVLLTGLVVKVGQYVNEVTLPGQITTGDTNQQGVWSWEDSTYIDAIGDGTTTGYAKFTPTNTDIYEISRETLNLTIEKGQHTFNDEMFENYLLQGVQGSYLSTVDLSAVNSAFTSGQFSWQSPSVILSEIGEHRYTLIFSPTDSTNYESTTYDVLITVVAE